MTSTGSIATSVPRTLHPANEAVGAFAASVRLSSIPERVADHARLIILDTLGAIILGAAEPELVALRTDILRSVSGTASVPGEHEMFPPSLAAFLNGMSGTWHELDEGNYPTHQHPAIHVIPAALAIAESEDSDGGRLVEAIIAGYEVAGRTGRATRFRDDVMHPHGTHGTIGGAVAAALLLNLESEGVASAIAVATSMTTATSRPTVFEGATVRNTYAGQAGQNSVMAALAARAGIRGERDGVGSVFGRVSGTGFDHDDWVAGLGEDFILESNYFKFHACCAYNHATLDALAQALADRPVTPDEVDEIVVHTYFPATRMTSTDASSMLGSKFSIPYAVAAYIVLGSSGPDAFSDSARMNLQVRQLMSKVRVIEDHEATEAYPIEQRSHVRVVVGARALVGSVDSVRGDHRQPVGRDEIVDKFFTLVAPLMGESAAVEVSDAVAGLGRGISARELGATLRRPVGVS